MGAHTVNRTHMSEAPVDVRHRSPKRPLEPVICVDLELDEPDEPTEGSLPAAAPSLREAVASAELQIVADDADVDEERDRDFALVSFGPQARAGFKAPRRADAHSREKMQAEERARLSSVHAIARAKYHGLRPFSMSKDGSCLSFSRQVSWRGVQQLPSGATPGEECLLGPGARHQFKRPRALATPARAEGFQGRASTAGWTWCGPCGMSSISFTLFGQI